MSKKHTPKQTELSDCPKDKQKKSHRSRPRRHGSVVKKLEYPEIVIGLPRPVFVSELDEDLSEDSSEDLTFAPRKKRQGLNLVADGNVAVAMRATRRRLNFQVY